MPWSVMDIFDLENYVARGIALKEVADFLMRREDEVLAKVTELGLSLSSGC